jgi:type VI secretion system protein ImpC
MRLLLLGDFSGRAAGVADDAATEPPWVLHRVDIDNLDQVVHRIAPRVPLPASAGTPAAMLDIESLDDFHPDRLAERVELCSRLIDLRGHLQDPARFDQAADELRSTGLARTPLDEAPPDPGMSGDAENDAATLQRLLGRDSTPAPAATPPSAGGIDAMIRNIVAPHIAPDRSTLQEPYIAAVDAAIGDQIRHVLHAPAFTALEMAWRGVQWLVSRLELNDDLQLYLLDASRDRLLADFAAGQGDLSRSALGRLLCGQGSAAPDGPRWSLLVGLFDVGAAVEDLDLLGWLGALAAQAGGPFVAGAAPALFGCQSVAGLVDPKQWQPLADDVAQRWSDLRRCAVAPWVGLVAPRLLLRLPYGKATDPTERFPFEEQGAVPVHETLAWGPGSLAVALLIGQAFSDSGWDLILGQAQDLADLPAYTFSRDGEPQLQPCAEAWLGERAGQALLDRGLMPLLSHRQRAAVRLMCMQSIAEPTCALAGAWQGRDL